MDLSKIEEVLVGISAIVKPSRPVDGRRPAAVVNQMNPSNPKLADTSLGLLRPLSPDEREQRGPGRMQGSDRRRRVIQLDTLTKTPPDAANEELEEQEQKPHCESCTCYEE